jgi:protein-L-isoaspartate(D-aspartate) O-methyltransferase
MGEQAKIPPRPAWPPEWPDIKDPAVQMAMATVPRHRFVPAQFRAHAYEDAPLPIGEDQTISQPYIVALMTQALRLGRNSRVLEIGTGSGYQAAVLATLTPHVYSVEARPALAAVASEHLRELGYSVILKVGDGCLGWPEHAPYQAIIVTAAPPSIPPALVQQLADHGRLVIPVGRHPYDQHLWVIKRAGRRLQARRITEVRFVPLVGEPCEDGPLTPDLARIRRQLQHLFPDR